jgi:hypothetical protein
MAPVAFRLPSSAYFSHANVGSKGMDGGNSVSDALAGAGAITPSPSASSAELNTATRTSAAPATVTDPPGTSNLPGMSSDTGVASSVAEPSGSLLNKARRSGLLTSMILDMEAPWVMERVV